MRDELRIFLLTRYRTQLAAARALGISESRLSRILRGHNEPTETELQKLRTLFSSRRLARLLKTETGNTAWAEAVQI